MKFMFYVNRMDTINILCFYHFDIYGYDFGSARKKEAEEEKKTNKL